MYASITFSQKNPFAAKISETIENVFCKANVYVFLTKQKTGL